MKYVLLIISSVSLVVIIISSILIAKKGTQNPVPFIQQQINKTTYQKKLTTLVFGGDVMLGRTVTTTSLDIEQTPSYPFLKIADVMRAADISLVNLETPILDPCPRKTDGMVFCAPVKMLEGVTYSGIDIVNLANNHTKNYGEKGFAETERALTEKEIAYTGAGKLTTITKDGTTFGFLGFDRNQQSNPVLTKGEEDLILTSDKQVDVLIVSMHWGVEYKAHPFEGQRALAKKMIDLGADIIVGHHPHWVQDSETIDGVPVYYSLGNLVFDQMWSEETRKGLLVRLTLENKKIVKEEFLPTYIKNRGQPEIFY